jgi:glycosyltransferase involved in cell wall biosynthesis
MTANYGDRLVYDARAIARRWEHSFHRSGLFIPYGGDFFGPLPVEEGLSHRGYVLLVARFVPENTVAEFFAAVPAIAEVAPVVIVGSSGAGGELDQRAADLDASFARVRWLGHLSDDARLHRLWQHAGAYFHGHSVGGTNPALVQAMALGAPVVARDTVYTREVLGQAGAFVAPRSEAIADGVISLLADRPRAEAMSQAAMARAREHYNWDSVNAAYDKALRQLVRRSQSA